MRRGTLAWNDSSLAVYYTKTSLHLLTVLNGRRYRFRPGAAAVANSGLNGGANGIDLSCL